jgi:hypothetical protein
MGNSPTVPIFDPQGVLRDVPYEQLHDAVVNGGKPAVRFKAPDESIRYVPADQTQAAAHAGGKILPFEEQDVKHPGFWHALASDAAGMASGSAQMATQVLGAAMGQPTTAIPLMSQITENVAEAPDAWKARQKAGYELPYRITAPAGTAIGVNVPGMEEAAREGDIAGVAGHAVAVPATMAATAGLVKGAPAAITAAGDTLDAIANHPLTQALGKTVDIATFERLSKLYDAWTKTLPDQLRARAEAQKPVYPGASLPANPLPEQLNPSLVSPARTLPGMISPEVVRPPSPPIPARSGLLLSGETASEATPTPQPAPAENPEATQAGPNGSTIPRTLSGDSALRQILTGQDNANLLKIARSRGINVSQESQLKPGKADNLLINKIIDDFDQDELQEVRDQFLENSRFRHTFGNIGPEAWKTMSLQTYFPDMKIPAAQIARTAKAVANPAPADDLTGVLQQSVAKVKVRKLSDLQ